MRDGIAAAIGVFLLATAALPSSAAFGQSSGASTDVAPVTVTAPRRTAPWKPKESPVPVELRIRGSEVCNVIAQDRHLTQLFHLGMAPKVYEATRFPRTPDYSAPPVTPPGSPFPPALAMKDYFGGSGPRDYAGTAADDGSGSLDMESSDGISLTCLAEGRVGRDFRLPGINLPPSGGAPPRAFGGGASSSLARADYTRIGLKFKDKTLPQAFALFDHGRWEEALIQFKAAHKKLPDGDGGDEAALTIGKLYLYAFGDRSDPVQAVSWLKKAANARFDPVRMTPRFDPREPERNTAMGEAAMILADVYAEGRGAVARDPAQSRKYLERALTLGHISAGLTLGDIYYNGVDTPKDPRKAFDAYMKAATFGYGPAAVAVARMYEAGEVDGKADGANALVWYAQAAKVDHPDGLHALAVAYDRGEGLVADPDKALLFYKLAAVQGDPASQAAIGTYFYRGEAGLPHDAALARKWFELAAVAGDPDGMVNLAAMQAKGEGGDLDRVKAWGWLKIAERQGHEGAGAAATALEAQLTSQERAGVAQLKRAG